MVIIEQLTILPLGPGGPAKPGYNGYEVLKSYSYIWSLTGPNKISPGSPFIPFSCKGTLHHCLQLLCIPFYAHSSHQ